MKNSSHPCAAPDSDVIDNCPSILPADMRDSGGIFLIVSLPLIPVTCLSEMLEEGKTDRMCFSHSGKKTHADLLGVEGGVWA